MTTPPTPAGWYPDPEQSGQLRYWDGAGWTEHLSPSQPQTPFESEPHAAPGSTDSPVAGEPAPEPEPSAGLEDPTTKVPLREWSFEPPPLEPESMPGYGTLPETEEPTTKVPLGDPTTEPTPQAAGEPAQEATPEPAPYADATTSTPPEPPAVEPPAGTEPQVPVDNRKLVRGFGIAVAALLLALILAAVYAFAIHKPGNTQLNSPTSETSSTTTTQPTTTSQESPGASPAPPPGAGAVDGPLSFSVTGVESGPTVTDPTDESMSKNAQGEFIVVRLTVQNTSPDPGQFLGTFQKLKAGGQVFSIDDEATFYVGGGFVDIPPGGQVDVGVAYDVPPGTVPESIELHADPISPGVDLPLG